MKTSKTIKMLLKHLFKNKFGVVTVLVLSVVSVLFGVSIPYLIGVAVDATNLGVGQVDFNTVYKTLIYIVIAGITYPVINYITNAIASKIAYNLVVELRTDVFEKIHLLPLKTIDTRQIGELSSLVINDLELVIDGISHVLTLLLSSIITIIASISIMIYLDIYLALIIIVITPVAFILTKFITTKSYKSFKEAQQITAQYNAYTNEIITEARIVTAFNYQEIASKKANDLSDKLTKARQNAMFFSSLNNPTSRYINNITYVIVALVGGLAYINNLYPITIGVITSLLFYANQFAKPLNEITAISTEIQASLVACNRVFSFLELENDYDESDKPNLEKISGNVTFENVSFRYIESKPLIENFNLDVKQGEVVAIVGPTGAGKTTIVNLLMRFYEANSGKILLDGKSIYDYKKESVRKQFGMVLQETWLKNATIKENLLYGTTDITEEQMIEVAKRCRVHDFISRLPDGYNTIVTEVSYRVSQGEKQLITIARAMLNDPNILILDEATSAVDTRTELLIQDALDTIMKDKTSFIIAHRLSTIVNADKILVLNKGQIVEIGNHFELLEKKGFYYKLYNSQFVTSIRKTKKEE